MKKLCLLFLLFSCLTACANKKNIICTYDKENIKMTNTIEATDDIVNKQTINNELNYKLLGYSLDEIENLTDLYSRAYDIDGVSYTYEIKDDLLYETIVVDYEHADMKKLEEFQLILVFNDSNKISLEKTIQSLEAMEYKCEK